MSESDTLFPAVHRYGEEQLGVKSVNGQDQFSVIPLQPGEHVMKDYYAHETAHLFGFDNDDSKVASHAVNQRAAEQLKRRQDADAYLKARTSADNLEGSDTAPGLFDIADSFGLIEVTSTDGLDLELLHHLEEQQPEIAKLVAQGAPVQAQYLRDIGTISVDDAEVVDLFETLRGSGTLKDTQKAILRLCEVLPPRHARRLKDATTQVLNDTVGVGLGTGIRVDDFCDDVGDLLELIEGKHGARYSQVLLDDVPKRIGERCAILIKVTDDNNETIAYQHCLMGVYTSLPLNANQLNLAIGTRLPFGFVSQSRFPELYAAMSAMLAIDPLLDKPAGFFDIRIETRDGYTMRVHHSLLGNKLLLSR